MNQRNQITLGRWDFLFLFRTGWGLAYEWLAFAWHEGGPEPADPKYFFYKVGPIEIRRRTSSDIRT